jgi:hypothetical protein
MISPAFLYSCIILDASCTITLYASGYMAGILDAIPVSITIAEYVYTVEALTIYGDPDPASGLPSKEKIDLEPLVTAGRLRVEPLAPGAEVVSAVNFAAALGDDGEAFTGAIAMHRNWAIATDDRSAISFFKRQTPQLQVVTTPELVKQWADTTSPTAEQVRIALRNVRSRGRYAPYRTHPLYNWWQANT